MVLVHKWDLFHVFIFGKIGKKKVSVDILERKNALLDYKNKKQKKSKNWPFSKGVRLWFWSKNGIFSHLFIFGKIRKKKVSGHILGRKHAFLDYNNKKEKTSKKWPFSKGVSPGFWSKNGIFSTFLFLAK